METVSPILVSYLLSGALVAVAGLVVYVVSLWFGGMANLCLFLEDIIRDMPGILAYVVLAAWIAPSLYLLMLGYMVLSLTIVAVGSLPAILATVGNIIREVIAERERKDREYSAGLNQAYAGGEATFVDWIKTHPARTGTTIPTYALFKPTVSGGRK